MSFVDLHIHSSHSSDGEWPVGRIVEEASRLRLAAFSISDHDSVAAMEEAAELTRDLAAEFIPSVEISTGFKGARFHLLAPFVDWRSDGLNGFLAEIRQNRRRQARLRVARLRQVGFEIEYDKISEATEGKTMTGPAIADFLLKDPWHRDDPRLAGYRDRRNSGPAIHFHKDYFSWGGPAFVPKQEVGLDQAIRLVRSEGGVPILAHPGRLSGQVTFSLLKDLEELGLEGLEVYCPYHDDAGVELFGSMAQRLGLVATAGSDFHGRLKPNVAFGSVREGDRGMLESLRERHQRLELDRTE